MRIIKVTWIDAQRFEVGVQSESELKHYQPIPCDIVGFMVHDDEERIVIAQEKWEEEAGLKYVHVIPKCSITKIVDLVEENER